MIVERLRCLRDPNFEKHPWHAGHLSEIDPIDPRIWYKDQQHRKFIGRRAWNLVQLWEKVWKVGLPLTSTERFMLFTFICTELYNDRG